MKKQTDPDVVLMLAAAEPTRLSILRELYLLRDARAREVDRPPFKVLGNRTLLEIAERKPRKLADLEIGVGGDQRVGAGKVDDLEALVVVTEHALGASDGLARPVADVLV